MPSSSKALRPPPESSTDLGILADLLPTADEPQCCSSRRVLVLQIFRVEIHRSARRHQVPDNDIAHAYEHAVVWAELGP